MGHITPIPPAEEPAVHRHTLHGGLNLSAADLRLVKRNGFDLPQIAGWDTYGPVGMPALPQQLQYAVLPAQARVIVADVDSGAPLVLPGPIDAYPVQPPFPTPHQVSPPAIVPLQSALTGRKTPYPSEQILVGQPRLRDGLQLIPLRIRPVQYDPARRTYVFHPRMQFVLRYELRGEMQAYGRPPWLDELAEETMLHIPDGLISKNVMRVRSARTAIPYVIITDNTFWPESVAKDGRTRPPKESDAGAVIGAEGSGGNLQDGPVGHFERLAEWKASRGVRTRVVTIKDILAKKYGDCTEGDYARDLQEVIRNFLIMAHRDWDTEYVLLGGHPRIVPIRQFLGHVTCSGSYPGWDFYKYDETTTIGLGGGPPPRGRLYCYNNTLLCHDSILGRPTRDTPLVTAAGKIIHFKSTSDATLGWYFEDQRFLSGPCLEPVWWKCPKDFSDTAKDTEICNIVVEGPKEIIDDDMHWALPERLVPSDVYYAELTPTSDQSGHHHAFDSNGNGFYGEYKWNETEQAETSIDGMDSIMTDVRVGRAPVLSGKEAQHFVDKVLAYETLTNADGETLDPEFLTRKLVVADVWRSEDHVGKHRPCWSDGAVPEAGEFIKPAGETHLIVHLQPKVAAALKEPGAHSRVVARFYAEWGGTDAPVKKRDATDEARRDTWRFVKRSGNAYVSSDSPTDYVRLEGPAFVHRPEFVLWHYSPSGSCDNATTEADELVDDGFNRFDEFETERCLTESYMSFGSTPLNAANVRTALDRGPHLVGVYGHGSENGLSYIYWHDNDGASREFRNVDRPFIMYANSCLTANPGHATVRSLGEILVTHKNGAVAYVGYTRVGFQEGHKQQQRFFKALDLYGRPGKAAEVRCAETQWQTYEQILYGDPEMPVWNKKPRRYLVFHPESVDRLTKLKVVVLAKTGGIGLQGQRVTLMAGWRGSDEGPRFLVSANTGEDGRAELDMAGWPDSEAMVSLTVTPALPAGQRGAYVPYRVMLPVYGYQRGWRRCKHCQTLFHQNARGSFCPRSGGGLHVEAEGEKYRIIADTPAAPSSIQQGWRWCRNCQALHFPGTGETCHNAGGHNDTGSGAYAVEIISSPDTAQPAWRFCDKCRVLHLVKDGVAGPCHAGGTHAAGGSYYRVQST